MNTALPNCILQCGAAQSRLGSFISRGIFGNISIFWDKKLEGKAVQVLLIVSGSGVCAYQNKQMKGGKRNPKQPNPNNLPVKTCRTLDLHTCVHFLNLSAYLTFDPSSRVEWCGDSIWENADAELLDFLFC